MLGAMFLVLSGVLFTLLARSNKPKTKVQVDFDDLAPGLNIDLRYYLSEEQHEFKKRKNKDEKILLLG